MSRSLAAVVGTLVLAGGLLTSGYLHSARADPQERRFRATNLSYGCGVYSSAIWIRRATGRKVTYADVSRVADEDGDGLCSLADVCRALGDAGIGAKAYRASGLGPEFLPRQRAMVRLVRGPVDASGAHLCYVEPRSGGEYAVYYPPLGVSIMSAEALSRNWDGHYVAQPSAGSDVPGVGRILCGVLLVIVGALLLSLGLHSRRQRGA